MREIDRVHTNIRIFNSTDWLTPTFMCSVDGLFKTMRTQEAGPSPAARDKPANTSQHASLKVPGGGGISSTIAKNKMENHLRIFTN